MNAGLGSRSCLLVAGVGGAAVALWAIAIA